MKSSDGSDEAGGVKSCAAGDSGPEPAKPTATDRDKLEQVRYNPFSVFTVFLVTTLNVHLRGCGVTLAQGSQNVNNFV